MFLAYIFQTLLLIFIIFSMEFTLVVFFEKIIVYMPEKILRWPKFGHLWPKFDHFLTKIESFEGFWSLGISRRTYGFALVRACVRACVRDAISGDPRIRFFLKVGTMLQICHFEWKDGHRQL